MFNITKFKQIVSPVLLLASILLFNNLTLAAAIGGPGVAVVALRTIDQDLLDATRDGDGAAVVQALAAGADVNTRYNDGWTALMEAAWRGHTAIATQLLAAGADVNASNNDDWTVLMLAVWRGHAAIATQLLAAGADVHTRNNNGWTALIIATTNGHTAIVTQLLTAGAEIPTILQEHAQILAQPGELRDQSPFKRTLLSPYQHKYMAAQTITLADIREFIAEHADNINMYVGNPADQVTLLMLITGKSTSPDTPEMIRRLCAAGANANLQDQAGNTALHYVFKSQLDFSGTELYRNWALIRQIVIALKECGADINITNYTDTNIVSDPARYGWLAAGGDSIFMFALCTFLPNVIGQMVRPESFTPRDIIDLVTPGRAEAAHAD